MRAAPPGMNRHTELAWAAGFFDGEGWAHYNARARALEIGVGQKDARPLRRLHDALGVGRIYRERRDTFGSWRAVNAADQYVVIRKLWPYLSEPKREQIREALDQLREGRAILKRRVAKVEVIYDLMEEVIRGS